MIAIRMEEAKIGRWIQSLFIPNGGRRQGDSGIFVRDDTGRGEREELFFD